MQESLISVIVPIYNTEKYLDNCIESITNQSYKNLDIILVNDGSTDKSKSICEKWMKNDSRIRLINQENMGAAMAKNTGLDSIKGDLFVIVDSDDILYEKNIEVLYKYMEKENADIIEGCHTIDIDEFNNIDIEYYENNKSIKTFSTEEALKELIISRKFHQTPWNKIYKIDLLKNIRFPKGRYIDDEYWTYKLFANAEKVVSLDNITYYYRQHGSSTMGRNYSVRRLDAIDALYERYVFMKDNFPRLKNLAYKAFLNNCIFNFQKLCLLEDLDINKEFRKNLLKKYRLSVKEEGLNRLSKKDKIIFYSFYKFPYSLSKIRNRLRRGI